MATNSLVISLLLLHGVWAEVSRRDLIDLMKFKPDSITRRSIMADNNKLSDELYNPNESRGVQLAYVTPWNGHGYDLAKQTAHKLSHVSPVWFQAKPIVNADKVENCKIEGTHDIDREWINALRQKNEKIKIVPRILFEGWDNTQMEQLLVNTQTARRCSKVIADFYKRNEFDGAVVEVYMQALMAMQSLKSKSFIIETMEQLAKMLKKQDLIVIYTVPAPLEWNNQPNQLILPEEYDKLIQMSDYVQIMTYDYRGNKPTGVAPYDWMENCIFYLGGGRTPKTLVGINWYGYEFSSGKVEPITTKRFLEALRAEDAVYKFDEEPMEHKLKTRTSVIYYPSLSSLELRINLAHRYEAGIAIWDYGQGLDHFSNLLF